MANVRPTFSYPTSPNREIRKQKSCRLLDIETVKWWSLRQSTFISISHGLSTLLIYYLLTLQKFEKISIISSENCLTFLLFIGFWSLILALVCDRGKVKISEYKCNIKFKKIQNLKKYSEFFLYLKILIYLLNVIKGGCNGKCNAKRVLLSNMQKT